jgi:cytochrome P450
MIRYEPFCDRVREDPYPYYTALREEAPVYWAEEAEAWCVSRHEDVVFVLKNPSLFSSDAMRAMLIGVRPGVDPLQDPQAMQRLFAIAQSLPWPPDTLATACNVIAEDPPRHEVLRRLVNRAFTPRRVAGWELRAREIVDVCLAKLRDGEDFDVVAELAVPLPVRIIAEMLGVEPERIADFKRWGALMIAGSTGSTRRQDPITSGLAGAMGALAEYVLEVIAARESSPGDDLVSTLIAAQDGEAGLSAPEVVLFVMLLLVAGNETTTNLIGSAAIALLDHPGELARVRSDRGLLPSLVEEALRWESPIQFVFRRATADVEIRGRRIPANSHVIALIGSANRDEREFGADAARFDAARNPQGHLAFGLGNHFCLGASLARLEARVALDALIEELPRVERCERRTRYVDSFLVRGPERLMLRRVG